MRNFQIDPDVREIVSIAENLRSKYSSYKFRLGGKSIRLD